MRILITDITQAPYINGRISKNLERLIEKLEMPKDLVIELKESLKKQEMEQIMENY